MCKLCESRLDKCVSFPCSLTSAALLSRIMKMIKLSNQLCSTIRQQVFLSVHHTFPQPTSTFTWQHWNLCTQPGKRQKGDGELPILHRSCTGFSGASGCNPHRQKSRHPAPSIRRVQSPPTPLSRRPADSRLCCPQRSCTGRRLQHSVDESIN